VLLHRIAFQLQSSFGGDLESVRLRDGQRGSVVEESQMTDLIAHRPSLGRSGGVPPGLVPRGDQTIEVGVLGSEVVEQRQERGGLVRHEV
jgi:hypothetical protein